MDIYLKTKFFLRRYNYIFILYWGGALYMALQTKYAYKCILFHFQFRVCFLFCLIFFREVSKLKDALKKI
jgi:hypothetical protein